MAAEERIRKFVQDREEAAMSLAFEEADRLLDRVAELSTSIPASLADVTAGFVTAANATQKALDEYAAAVKVDVSGSGDQLRAALSEAADRLTLATENASRAISQQAEEAKQGVRTVGIGVAESVREGAKQAGIDGAVAGYLGVEQKAIKKVDEAAVTISANLGQLQTVLGELKKATATMGKPAAGVSIGSLITTLAVFSVVLLGGFWIIQKSQGPNPALAAGQVPNAAATVYRSLSRTAQNEVWTKLPADVQLSISRSSQTSGQ
jgi:hypothetical protein